MELTVQSIVDYLKQPRPPRGKVVEYLHHSAVLVRVNAIEAAGRLAREDESLIGIIAREAAREENTVKLLGNTTVGHVAVGCLLRIGNPSATLAAGKLIESWPASERSELMWYLKAEGLLQE